MVTPTQSKFQDQPMTLAYIRNEVRNRRFIGDMFEAIEFLLNEYDTVNSKLKSYTKPTEYNVKRMDVV